uniref:glycerophosphodiester phosphodiesterase 1-like n=1 Tax=Solea senegalensis TaxID=28829 RepID=UPI001CD8302A|nr:glycerophosphodiester phosphodiesterase 1-like [Solea senegalensis]
MLLMDEVNQYSVVFVVVLLVTRSLVQPAVFVAALYLFLALLQLPRVPVVQAQRVLHPTKVSVVAHRGGGHDAPENTIAAIRQASKNGATGVELDVEFSADGVPILMHDKTVDRTTDGSGPLSQMRFSELRQLDAVAKHRLRDKFVGERIPTLQEAVEECIRLRLTIYFDVKGQPDQAIAAFRELYRKHPVLYNSSIICSFEPKLLYWMRQSDPHVVTALIHRPWSLSQCVDAHYFDSLWKYRWMTLVMDVVLDCAPQSVVWRLCGISAFLIHKDFVSLNFVQHWAERGVEVVVWTVNTNVEKSFYQEVLQVNYITDSLVEDCSPTECS